MKVLIAFLLIASLAMAYATNVKKPIQISKPILLEKHNPNGDEFFCKICINFMGSAIDDLIEIIANIGVGATCSAVCGELPNHTEATICDLLCEIVGIDAFIHIVDDVDPDPIAICEDLTVCEHSTNASAKINSVSVSPSSGPVGTTFNIQAVYTVTSTIATGQVEVVVVPPDAFPFGGAELVINQGPGTYGIKLSFQATPSENEPFNAGLYQAVVSVCEGTCGSPHHWSYTLAQSSQNFTISG